MQEKTKTALDTITVVWVFTAHKAYQFTLDQILSLVDGLSTQKLIAAFRDVHVDGGTFAHWFERQNPAPCTLRPDFVAFLRSRLTRLGKTVATLKDPAVFVYGTMAAYWASAKHREAEAAKQKEADRRQYLVLLCRADEPQAGDTEELARLVKALGKTPQRLEQDLKIIREARELRKLVAQWQRLSEAGQALQRLANANPDFFDTTGICPRVLGDK